MSKLLPSKLFLVCFALISCLGFLTKEIEAAKNSFYEPRLLSIEPAPILGDCPCSKVECNGPNGVKGDKGASGPQGPKGDQGLEGPRGQEGKKGDPGVRGVSGSPGKPGSPGKDGADGRKGELGASGPKGDEGLRGLPGPSGHKGERGAIGPVGPQGREGPKGDAGVKGDKGIPGHNGQEGPEGPKGPKGPHGVTGPQGPKGSIGPRGPTGIKGSMGSKGDQGLQGASGADGPRGLPGLQGDRGPKGAEGSCSSQCADMKKEMLKEIEKLRAEISVLKPTTFPPPTGPLGSITNPALSCKHIKDSNYHVRSGAYYVLTDTPGRKSRVYCHMENLGKCGGGGWTSVMKLDGNKKTFTYSSPLWSNKKEYQPYYGTSAFGRHETKLATYWSAPFNHVCVGMRTARYSIQFLRIRFRAKSLFDVIADGKYKKFHFGRDAWKGLVKDGSLQKHCNKEGFNIDIKFSHIVAARARIGIVSNQENDCWSCDSRIGFGMDGVLCGQDKSNSCGNEARCSPDNGDRSIKTLGYIFVQ